MRLSKSILAEKDGLYILLNVNDTDSIVELTEQDINELYNYVHYEED